MEQQQQNAHQESIDALAEALQPVALVMLKGNLSAAVLVQAAKLAYIRAALDSLSAERQRTSISRLSVITGMTRKEVASYLSRKSPSGMAARSKKPMEHRALRVLRAWTSDPRYKTASGRVIDLPVDGDGKTFASLVRAHGGDVTPVAVLRELERLGVITTTVTGQLRVRSRDIQARLPRTARLREFSRLVANFSGTAAQVLLENQRALYFGYRDLEVLTESQGEKFKRAFGRRASLLLEGVGHWKSRHATSSGGPQASRRAPAQRIGLGIYLVENRTTEAQRPRAKR